MSNEANLRDRAIISELHIGKWEPFKRDSRISDKIAEEHHATKRATIVRKNLFPPFKDATNTLQYCFPALQRTLNELNSFYVWHAEHTLLWDGHGQRLLAADFAEEHRAKRDAVIEKLPSMKDDMRAGYLAAIMQAEEKLNGMFRQNDYPGVEELCARFYVRGDYHFVPTEHIDSKLPSNIAAMLNSQVHGRIQASLNAALGDAWERMYATVKNLQSKLASPNAIFRDSLVGNVKECCELLAKLNVTGNEELEAMRKQVLSNCAGYDPERIRDNATLRAEVASNAGVLLETMERRIVKLRKASAPVLQNEALQNEASGGTNA